MRAITSGKLFKGTFVAVASASLFATAAMASTIGTPLTPEITVANNIPLPYSGYTSVAHDANGNFVVAWYVPQPYVGNQVITFRRFAADGTPLGNAVQVAGSSVEGTPALAMDADGDFVIAWRDFGDSSGDYHIYAQVFSPDGIAVGAPVLVAQLNASITRFLDSSFNTVAAAMNTFGDFVVAWDSEVSLGGANDVVGRWTIQLRRFHLNGAPYSAAAVVEQKTSLLSYHYVSNVHLSMNDAGNFATVWGERGGPFKVRYYAADATPTSSAAVLPVQPLENKNDTYNTFATALENNGELLLAYTIQVYQTGIIVQPQTVYLQRYSGATPDGQVVTVAARQLAASGEAGDLAITALPSGGGAVVWSDDASAINGVTGSISAEVFSAANSSIGAFSVGSYPQDLPQAGAGIGIAGLSVTTDASGNLWAVWNAVKARLFSAF